MWKVGLSLLICQALASLSVAQEKKPEIFTIAKAQGKNVRNSEGSVTQLKDGSLFVVYQEFERGDGDSDFFPGRLVGKSSKDGTEWTNHRVIVENEKGDINVFSPSLLRLSDNSTLLCFMRYHSFAKATNKYPPASAFAWISRDECKTFQPLATLWKEKPTTLCSATLRRLKSGRLVIPVNRDLSKKGDPDHWEAGTIYSDDIGKTWTECTNHVDLPKRGAMEPHVEETVDNKLLMVMRTQLGHVYKAESADGGKSWSKGETLGIEAPESCPELVKVPETSDLVLIWNASRYDPKWASHFGKRTPLSAALSKDGGKTWGPPRHIETDPKWAFSNPGLFFFGDKAILNYWACEYQKNGSMSNYPIHLKGAIIDKRWFYGKD